MNSLIEWLNRAGELWLAHALSVSWQIAILVVVFLLVDRWLAHSVRAVVRHAWWCLILLKLVLPPNFASPTGAGYWLHSTPVPEARPPKMAPSPTEAGVRRADPVPSPAPNLYRLFTGAAPRQPDQGTPLSWEGWLYLLWLAGVIGLASLLIHRARRVNRLVRGASPLDRDHAEMLRDAAADLGLKRLPRLLVADGLSCPAVCGLWRPVILLPPRLVPEMGTTGLRAVLLHELAHVRRGDLWVNLLQSALQALYWWHPLVWIANARMRAVREQATDEMVVVAQSGEVENYAQALVTVARSALRVPAPSLGLVGILEWRRALRCRVERLLSMPIPRSSRLGWVAWCSLPLLAAVLLPMAPRPAAAFTPAEGDLGRWQDVRLSHSVNQVAGPSSGPAGEFKDAQVVEGEGLMTRTFRLNLEQVRRRLGEMDLPSIGDLDDDPLRRLPAYLSAKGFSLQPPNTFFLKYGMGLLMVRASPPEIDVVERALEEINRTPAMVEIETKVWEIPEALVRRLELDALVTRHPVAGWTNLAVLTRKESADLAKQLERQGGLKPWPTPRITTLDRRRAEITVRASPEQAAALPLRKRDVLSVAVDPKVAGDGYTISLVCEGWLTELVDLHPDPADAGRADPPPKTSSVYSVNALGYVNHAVKQAVTVYDGQSALVLIPGAEPIPGLGASAKSRRFLLAMSPRLIDPAGNWVHADGQLPRPADEVPAIAGEAKPGTLPRR